MARMNDDELLAAYHNPPPCSTAACMHRFPRPVLHKREGGKRKVGVLKGHYHMRRRGKDDVQQRVSLHHTRIPYWGWIGADLPATQSHHRVLLHTFLRGAAEFPVLATLLQPPHDSANE